MLNCSDVVLSQAASATVASFNVFSGLLSVGGNTVVLAAMFRSPSLWTTSNVFIASLALADLIVGALANTLYVSLSLMKSLRDVRQIKNTETFVWLLTVTATTYNLCAVSIDRYIAVTKPLKYYQLVTVPRCLVAVGITWIFAILLALASFIVPLENIAALWMTGSIVTVFIPLIIISFCYFQILRAVRSQLKKIATTNTSEESQDSTDESPNKVKNRKAAWTFAIVIALFGVLFLPSLVVNFMSMRATSQCEFFEVNRLWFWTSMISYSSSAINPWIYAIRMNEFRTAFKKLFLCQ